jgi:hypothetical protein
MTDKRRVLALLELGWTYRRIERETGGRRETVARLWTHGVRQKRPTCRPAPAARTGLPGLAAAHHEQIEAGMRHGLTAQRIWQTTQDRTPPSPSTGGFVPLPSRPRHHQESSVAERSGVGNVRSNALNGHRFEQAWSLALTPRMCNSRKSPQEPDAFVVRSVLSGDALGIHIAAACRLVP